MLLQIIQNDLNILKFIYACYLENITEFSV